MDNKIILNTNIGMLIRISDGSAWTFPTTDKDNEGSVAWKLRYARGWQPTEEEKNIIASIIDDYVALVKSTCRRRERIVRDINGGAKNG